MLFLIFEVTMMISSVMPNTAATALMTPIVIDMLKIYEKEGAIKLYETNAKGEQVASDITTCYLCAIAYSATFGGVMTLIGSATNLAFKGLYEVMSGSSMLAGLAAGLNLGSLFPGLPGLVSTDELPFLHFTINSFLAGIFASKLSFIYLIILFLGVGRNNSQAAKDAAISQPASDAVKKYFDDEMKKLGGFTMCEGIVLTFFIIALLLFAFRSPIFFTGIGPELALVHKTDMQFIRDSALATVVCMVLFILPASMEITKNFKVKYHEELPTAPCPSALNWAIANSAIPFSFIFLLGGGFALVEAGKTSMLHAQFTQSLQDLRKLPGEVLIFIIMLLVMIITNLASNVVVANLLCPIAMIVAGVRGCHSLWFCMAAGYAASFCFVLPIGNPGNLMVYRAGNIPLKKMMLAGIGPSIITLIIFYASIVFLSPYLFSGFTCISGDLSNIVNPSLVPPPLA